MFPSKLHKNILELDRQISVLENECKNIKMDKRKNNFGNNNKCNGHNSKGPHSRLKSPPVRDCPKKLVQTSRKTKKPSPPLSARVYSTSSLPSNCSKHCSIADSIAGDKIDKQSEEKTTLHPCNCQNSEGINSEKSDCVLHKELLFSNSGSTIEVTVKQTPNLDKKREIITSKKTSNNNENEFCKCQCTKNKKNLGQKWSEILSLEPTKLKEEFNSLSKINDNEPVKKESCSELIQSTETNEEVVPEKIKKDIDKNNIKTGTMLEVSKHILCKNIAEKDNQYSLKNGIPDGLQIQSSNSSPFQVYQLLMNDLVQKLSKEIGENKLPNKCNHDLHRFIGPQNDVFQTIQKLCDNLIKEKELLSRDLAAKNNIIETMKKREDEYASMISSLKLKLEKSKDSARENLSALNELNNTKQKLMEQIKINDALKSKHVQMKESLDKLCLENDKLTTRIQIYKLNAHKHDVLMAGKEAEIKKYKEEIRNFQKQISEHLASLKSNAKCVDMKKMMEAIIQQCHSLDDLDSVCFEGNFKESLKPTGLVHSSPTSTKNSDVNSSWKQISSIRDLEPVISLHESNDKEFYQVYGHEVSISTESHNHPLSKQNIEKLNLNNKTATSFTSCLSITNNENDITEIQTVKNCEKDKEVPKAGKINSNLTSNEIKGSIDKLLKSMKLKWSEEIYQTPSDNGAFEGLLNCSQAISISE